MIALPPRPEPQLRCCAASGCRSAGGEALLQALRQAARRGGAPVAIKAVGCLRLCGRGPLLACDGPAGTTLYGDLRPEQAAALVALARAGGGRIQAAEPPAAAEPPPAMEPSSVTEPPTAMAEPAAMEPPSARQSPSVTEPPRPAGRATGAQPGAADRTGTSDRPATTTTITTTTATATAAAALAACRLDLDQPFFSRQQSLLLEHCGRIDPESLQDALAHGTYGQLQRCLRQFTPARLRAELRRSGLRGRGGAGYPTGLKWDSVALQPAGPRYVVCNADEGDPGAFMNRSLLEGDPHRLLEGIALAAYGIGAERGYVYVRAEYPLAIARMRLALEQARAGGLFAGDAAGGRFHLELEVRVGAGAYVCGEETALLASIQGRRGTPRPRPPFPAQSGLWGAPTLINNVETLAAVPLILRLGSEAYAAIGSPRSPGTKLFALSGAVRHSGLVEVPLGTSLRTIVETIGGGPLDQPDVPGGGALKAVQTGGPSGGCIPADQLDTPVDYESLRALGASIGSGGMVVIDAGMPMPLLARHFVAFSVSESCGKCVPCRAGTVQLAALLDRFVEHRATPEDLVQLEQLCAMVRDTSLCGLGQAAPSPVLSSLRWFRHEYEAAMQQPGPAGAMPAGAGGQPVTAVADRRTPGREASR
ncbi:MAG: NADH-ubiquinone oxidoreductase-F iron-sulfur binding region domain-containing protein [Synechococcus sp.]|nr:NADH-ubiquinone oxidoreductase-F iron-sulfur binding region domain-containing protein [Synechococcus sp.]